MKNCELCHGVARLFCDSDDASLCWTCDHKVHAANFLVARHSRSLLCHACHSPTPWSATGADIGATVTVCHACVLAGRNAELENRLAHDLHEIDSLSDDDEEEDGESQVVPWTASSETPPPPSSSSGDEDEDENLSGNGGGEVSSRKREVSSHPTTDHQDHSKRRCCSESAIIARISGESKGSRDLGSKQLLGG